MKTQGLRSKALTAVLIRSMGVITFAQAEMEDTQKRWQINTLNTPSESQIQREKSGSITIYHGLTDKTVENVMDKQFNRLQSMMFTGIIVSDSHGSAVINPNTGEVEIEDDGCD